MKSYKFIFSDGQRLTGDGNDAAEGLLNAYHRNGFLPVCSMIEKNELIPAEVYTEPKKKKGRPSPPPPPPADSNPASDR